MPPIATAALAIGIVASVTYGGQGGSGLTVTPDPAPAGSDVTLSGGCYSTASSFPISIADPNGDALASGNAPSDGSGDFSGTLPLPADATPGSGYYAFVVCDNITELVTRFSVVAAPGAGDPTSTTTTTEPTIGLVSTTSSTVPPLPLAVTATPAFTG